jgi:hypothetical protein
MPLSRNSTKMSVHDGRCSGLARQHREISRESGVLGTFGRFFARTPSFQTSVASPWNDGRFFTRKRRNIPYE